MIAATGLTYAELMKLLGTSDLTANRYGRQAAHAMAHDFYGCATHVILYSEESGTFGLLRKY
jgi:hypothetical protein